jgi:hypothetical protein
MLFYSALQVVGLLELAAHVYQLAGMVRLGVQQVFTELFVWSCCKSRALSVSNTSCAVISARSWAEGRRPA